MILKDKVSNEKFEIKIYFKDYNNIILSIDDLAKKNQVSDNPVWNAFYNIKIHTTSKELLKYLNIYEIIS